MCGHRHRRHAERRHQGRTRPARDPGLRVGDVERRAAQDRLAAHFAAGRLTEDELEARIGAADGARTLGELAALEADLPRDRQSRSPRAAVRAKATCLAAWNLPWIVPVGASWLV